MSPEIYYLISKHTKKKAGSCACSRRSDSDVQQLDDRVSSEESEEAPASPCPKRFEKLVGRRIKLNHFSFFYVYVVRLQSSFFKNTNVSDVSETKNAPFEQTTVHFYFFTSFGLPQLGGTIERRRKNGHGTSHHPENPAVGRYVGGAESTASNVLICIKF